MARKFLYFIALLIVMVIAALLALRIWSAELTRFAFVPRGPFETLPPLPAWRSMQVIAILAAGKELPFKVDSAKLDLPELQVRRPGLAGS